MSNDEFDLLTLIKTELKIIIMLFDSSYHDKNEIMSVRFKKIDATYIRLVWTYAILTCYK
jgi:hypothetical protein